MSDSTVEVPAEWLEQQVAKAKERNKKLHALVARLDELIARSEHHLDALDRPAST